MNNELLDLFQSRVNDMGGWCAIAGSSKEINSIIEEKYKLGEEEVLYSGRIVEQFNDLTVTGTDLTNISPDTRRDVMAGAKLGITMCDGLIAETGTAVLVNHIAEPRELSLLPERHVVIALSDQLYPTLDKCLEKIKNSYPAGKLPSITLISGPSRTSDIEKSLVVGVHGPVEFGVVVVDRGK